MSTHSHASVDRASSCAHSHVFQNDSLAAEKGTRLVAWITLAMMVVEITAGWAFNSMALLADGWHMSSHAVAIGVSAFAYALARRYANDPRFAFGTWKIEVLGGFASAIFLLGVAAMMVAGSIERLLSPQPIHYEEAIAVAVVGLIVNVVCALILGGAHGHDHSHHHDHAHTQSHDHDLNLKSAYAHVVADAATSVLAIIALGGGWAYGWAWLDPVMGVIGAFLVAVWARNLVGETGKVLLDREMDHPLVQEIRDVVSAVDGAGDMQIVDLHVWRVGKNSYSCALALLTDDRSLTPQHLRAALSQHKEIVHSTIEIQWRDSQR